MQAHSLIHSLISCALCMIIRSPALRRRVAASSLLQNSTRGTGNFSAFIIWTVSHALYAQCFIICLPSLHTKATTARSYCPMLLCTDPLFFFWCCGSACAGRASLFLLCIGVITRPRMRNLTISATIVYYSYDNVFILPTFASPFDAKGVYF